jgi:hypothetical protein
MRWKEKTSLFFVNKRKTVDYIFCSRPRVPIPFSFQPTGLISITENFPLILLRSLSATAPDNQQRLDSEGTGATVPELPDPVSTRNTAQPTRANATRRSCPHPRRDHHQGGQPSRAADRQGDRNDKSNRGGPA